MMDAIWMVLAPVLAAPVEAVLGAIAALVLLQVKVWFGVKTRVEANTETAQLRDRLEDALINGVEAALRAGLDAASPKAAEFVMAHLNAGVPDTLAGLKAKPDVLLTRVEAALARYRSGEVGF